MGRDANGSERGSGAAPLGQTVPVDRVQGLPTELAGLACTVPELLARRCERPDDPFIVSVDHQLTFGEADERSRVLAARLLAAGIGKGSRVGLLGGNDAAWAVAWLAIVRIGALSIPLSTFAPAGELGRSLRQTDSQAVLSDSTFAGSSLCDRLEDALPGLAGSDERLVLDAAPYLRWVHTFDATRPWASPLAESVPERLVAGAEAEVTPADLVAVVSTSGATAAPKAVVHSHGSLVRHAHLLARRRKLTREDGIYSPMPFFWVGGLTMVLLGALCSGGRAVVHERFSPREALDLIERERATQISCWPNASAQLAADPTFAARDLSAVRGGTLVEALSEEIRPGSPELAPIPLGMTETGGPHTGPVDAYLPLPAALAGTFGRGLPGMEHTVRDPVTGRDLEPGVEGELYVRGHFLMDGFYKRERFEILTADGWYPTGDLGWFGEDRYLRFVGRRTSMIKTGGSNVSPAEVESALSALPGVRTAAVVGVPHATRGEDVAAAIVADPGVALDGENVRSALRSALASYKVPRKILIVDDHELPTFPTGKIDLVALRALFMEETPAGPAERRPEGTACRTTTGPQGPSRD